MIDLGNLIDARLKEVHSRVYVEQAPQGTVFPYVVYILPNSTEENHREDFILEVQVWGNSKNTNEINNIAHNIDKKLNRLKYLDTNMQTSIYRVNRLMVPDPDPAIRRRELRYNCKTYLL